MFYQYVPDTFILRGNITLRERRGFLRLERIFGRGRYVLPYISHIGTYVPPHLVGFLGPFGLKTGIHFVHFGLETGMVFKGTRESMNVFIVSIPNE